MLFIMAVFLVTTKSKVGLCTVCLPVGLSAPCLKRVRRIEPIHGVKMAFGKVTSLGTPDSQNVLSQNCNSLRDEFVSKDFSWSIVDLTVHHEVKIFKNSHFNILIKKIYHGLRLSPIHLASYSRGHFCKETSLLK